MRTKARGPHLLNVPYGWAINQAVIAFKSPT